MKLSVKLISLLVLIVLAYPIILLQGCSTEMCGGCPSDSIAPYGSVLVAPEDGAYTIQPGSSGCINDLVFVLTDPDGQPLNGICVEVFTNGFVAEASESNDCSSNQAYAGYKRMRTDAGGTVTLDFLTPTLSCSGTSETEEATFFVQITSCSATATWTGTWTITCN